MSRARRWMTVVTPLTLLMVLSLAMGASLARAQDGEDPPHPAHIHSGSCDDLGDVVIPLQDVTAVTGGEVFGADTAILVKWSHTETDASLGDIFSAPHAVNIHESADNIQAYIACGDIGGRPSGDRLLIGLRELNDSGHSGVAVLEAVDTGTNVTIYLAEDEAATDAADAPAADTPAADGTPPAAETAAAEETPAAAAETPAAETEEAAAAGADVPVDIRDFAFSPNPVEIAVGDSVTWTNQDQVPHTATGDDRAVLQSGRIEPGASFSQTFDTAGEFGYFCEFHPNMTGTIVVQ